MRGLTIRIKQNPLLIVAERDCNRMYRELRKLQGDFVLCQDKASPRAHALANRHNALAARIKAKQVEIDRYKLV